MRNRDYIGHAKQMRLEGRITSDEFNAIYRAKQAGDEERARREYREILRNLARAPACSPEEEYFD